MAAPGAAGAAAAAHAIAAADFAAVLTTIGYSPQTVAYLATHNIDTVDNFNSFAYADFDNVLKEINKPSIFAALGRNHGIMFGLLANRKLKAFRAWLDYRTARGEPLIAAAFGEPEITKFMFRATELQQQSDSGSSTATAPDVLAKFKDFAAWEELFLTYLRQFRSVSCGTPLTYVVRADDVPTAATLATAYLTIDDELIETAVHTTPSFTIDNGTVYDLLKPLIVNGEGWSFIQPHNADRNGRGAFLALKQQAEGPAAKTARLAAAYGNIAKARFNGQSARHTFDMYVHTHQTAHNELIALGEHPSEVKKVTDFLNGISMPYLEIAKGVIFGDNEKLTSFEVCQQYIKTALQQRSIAGGSAGVAAVNTNQPNTPTRRERPNSGRGRGANPRPGKKPRIHGGHYTSTAWSSLNAEERAQVLNLRAQKKAAPSTPSTISGGSNAARSVSAVTFADQPTTIAPVAAAATVPAIAPVAAVATVPAIPRSSYSRNPPAVVQVSSLTTVRGSWLDSRKPTPPSVAAGPPTATGPNVRGTWKDPRPAPPATVFLSTCTDIVPYGTTFPINWEWDGYRTGKGCNELGATRGTTKPCPLKLWNALKFRPQLLDKRGYKCRPRDSDDETDESAYDRPTYDSDDSSIGNVLSQTSTFGPQYPARFRKP